ncbi:PH domain-containing protein [Nakamurella silvestris]|nr:PH domain-containing protein [Nakamurella silvestris]
MSASYLLQIRPRKISIMAIVAAVAVVSTMTFVGLTLVRDEGIMRQDGVYFRTADAVSMVLLGLLAAGGILLLARPRIRVDATGVRVRNVFSEKFVPWEIIERVAFPESSPWAQLILADDEYISVMAIQAMDKQRAVVSLKQVRDLQASYGPPPKVKAVVPLAPEPYRELGRLERIDQEMLARGPKTKKRSGSRS